MEKSTISVQRSGFITAYCRRARNSG